MPLPEVFQTIHRFRHFASLVLMAWVAMMAAAFLLLKLKAMGK